MQMYNDNPGMVQDKADVLLNQMIDLKENMVENIENLIQRDGKIEIIAEKAMQLSSVSNSYKSRSRKLKEQERRKRYCYLFVVFLICLMAAGGVVYYLFGGKSSESTNDSSNEAEPVEMMRLFLQEPE